MLDDPYKWDDPPSTFWSSNQHFLGGKLLVFGKFTWIVPKMPKVRTLSWKGIIIWNPSRYSPSLFRRHVNFRGGILHFGPLLSMHVFVEENSNINLGTYLKNSGRRVKKNIYNLDLPPTQ